jgi:hypothetical protein
MLSLTSIQQARHGPRRAATPANALSERVYRTMTGLLFLEREIRHGYCYEEPE